jgi:hypothetical protein
MHGYLKALVWAGIINQAVVISVGDASDLFLRLTGSGWVCFPFGDYDSLTQLDLALFVNEEARTVPELILEDSVCDLGRVLGKGVSSCLQ